VIERLLAADAALERGEPEAAERLYGQVADADPRNAIAVVGLAAVAMVRGDATGARTYAERALAIDPEEAAARRLLDALAAAAPAAAPAAASAAASASPGAMGTPQERRGGFIAFLRRLLRRA
jgi:tetratricopeptide (TPR) repeat protein